MNRWMVLVAMMAMMLTAAGNARGQEPHWKAVGWGGGGFYWACAFDPAGDGVIYMGGDVAGVYKTQDHGVHWRLINNGLANYAVYSLATDAQNPGTLYAGTEAGICKSTDGGEHWRLLEATSKKGQKMVVARGKSVHAIAVDPANGRNVYAGMPDGRIFKSSDGGETWTMVYQAKSGRVATLACSPKGGQTVLAATGLGVIRSEDGGKTWKPTGLTEDVSSVAMAVDGTSVYAAAGKRQMMKSTDGGETWTPINAGIAARTEMIDVAVDPADPNTVVCIGTVGWNGDCYRSVDGGKTWTQTRTVQRDMKADPTGPDEFGPTCPLSNPRNIAINPRNGKELYIAANWRPCYSGDGARTWEERDRGTDISCIYDIRFLKGKTYVAVMDEGLLMSPDRGENWQQLWPRKQEKMTAGHQWRIHVWEDGKRILTTGSPWDDAFNQAFLSEDGGKTFATVRQGLPDYLPKANTMWGRSYPRGLAADPKDPNILYLGMDGDPENGKSGGGIFKSTDGGKSWTQLPSQPAARRAFFALAVDPTDSQRIYWGACDNDGKGGLYRSEDGGKSWEHIFKGETWVFNVLVTPTGTVYCPGNQLWRSTDHGKTWQKLTNRNDGTTIVALEVDPTNENTVWFASTTWSSDASGGLYKSVDGGKTWQEITGDIGYRKPLVLRFDPESRELWAGGVTLHKLAQ
jgi:photosystem II stability/assembly factor-like uncharacterized protein